MGTSFLCCQGDPAAIAARGGFLSTDVVYEMVAALNSAFTHTGSLGLKGRYSIWLL